MDGIILILVLILMGGAIAFIGDRLGSKVGKKKLTLFGLRPKHTSTVVTIVTGILIVTATFGILTAASQDVRTALFGMEKLKAQMAELQNEAKASQEASDKAKASLAEKNAEFIAISDQVNKMNQRLTEVRQELQQAVAEKDRAMEALATSRGEVNRLQGQQRELEEKIITLNRNKEQLENDLKELQEFAAKLQTGIRVVREGAIVFQAGEVLASRSVDPRESEEQLRQEMEMFLRETNAQLLQRLNVDKDLGLLVISQREFDTTIDEIRKADSPRILRVVAAGNTVYGEPVFGALQLYQNQLIFAKGTTLLQEEMQAIAEDSGANEGAIIFFLKQVNALSVRQGVLPDPISGMVGSMPANHLYETAAKMSRLGGRVELSAVTVEDVHTAGPVRIELRVRAIK
ncbi:DUF3084 domain-containing protein [Anaeromusa acidaminophila]|uniref:DUF3084 domain-containing protein n=1 Tax=Anaeromusa acidaminophila TaxID=81464 RepID=UPI0003643489|nr:DUF3084 domain-containing protein [Anaeromusa acidaminophila]